MVSIVFRNSAQDEQTGSESGIELDVIIHNSGLAFEQASQRLYSQTKATIAKA